jgi:hypothetical protein
MNAPEKIYLFENPITETPDDRWLSKRSDEYDIEYARTDAFIEKAEKYLQEHLIDYWSQGVTDGRYGKSIMNAFVNVGKMNTLKTIQDGCSLIFVQCQA